jgi:hypothetical protein
MKLKTDILCDAGFTTQEIEEIQECCDAAEASGYFSHRGARVKLNGSVEWVCLTIAEILDDIRPGCWVDRSAFPHIRFSMTEQLN